MSLNYAMLSTRLKTLSTFAHLRSEPNCTNPRQPVLNVAPLNCVPYISSTNPDDIFSSPTQENAEAAETVGPAMIFLPSQSTREELNNIMNAFVVVPTFFIDRISDLPEAFPPNDSISLKDHCPPFTFPPGHFLMKNLIVDKSVIYQNLCPTGYLTCSFRLPGPVNPQQVTSYLADGILEVTVKKR
ncbi:hypothetical protein PTKIN_Ptkin06aG0203500 [Pterospermum kingtungense]